MNYNYEQGNLCITTTPTYSLTYNATIMIFNTIIVSLK